MIPQGSNSPIMIKLDTDISEIPRLIVTLWKAGSSGSNYIKKWEKTDMTINGDTAACPLTEAETKALPVGTHPLEIKGLDATGNAIFWSDCFVSVLGRRDKVITMTTQQTQGG